LNSPASQAVDESVPPEARGLRRPAGGWAGGSPVRQRGRPQPDAPGRGPKCSGGRSVDAFGRERDQAACLRRSSVRCCPV
jgi:hypothetical protein